MSILIKGMEMPMRCGDCPFYGLESAGNGMYYDFCEGGKFILCNPDNVIDENCPLVPVPPHGRLIDADDVNNHILGYVDLRDCPTIIEVEEIDDDSANRG
jgi:hypothetical protein